MAVTPWLVEHSLELAQRLSPVSHHNIEPEVPEIDVSGMRDHVIICGFGRVGQSVARMLSMEDVPYLVIDVDPIRVFESRSAGEHVIYGDATQKDLLHSARLEQAKLVLVTFSEAENAKLVINAARQVKDDVDVMVRTPRDVELEALYSAGASQVVPELQEGSLMLISQVMHYAGVPMSKILKRVREERKGRYDHLHGFYPGETTEISYNTADKLEFIHAIALGTDAFAVNKQLHELTAMIDKVKIKSVRRAGQEFTAEDFQERLTPGDILVIAGKPRRIERAERYLLDGY